ncbi:MAG: hypothetical protein NDJ90_05350 [Oligoflexia bacterium]|nr:hypothetical protein [Oligoflexia bacterium]
MKTTFRSLAFLVLALASLSRLSPAAHAGDRMEWGDLHWGVKFFLLQELTLDGPVHFKKDHRFEFITESGIPGIGTIVIEMTAVPCPFPELGSELVLVLPEDLPPTSRDRRVAVRMDPGCHMEFYVEAADYYSPSIFADNFI